MGAANAANFRYEYLEKEIFSQTATQHKPWLIVLAAIFWGSRTGVLYQKACVPDGKFRGLVIRKLS